MDKANGASTSDDGTIRELLREAGGHLARRRFDLAVDSATRAIRLDARRPEPYLIRAEALRKLDRHERALADITLAIRLGPERPASYVIRAGILAKRCQFDQAIADASQAIFLDPNNAAAFSIRASCRQSIGDPHGAAEDQEELFRIDPTRPPSLTDGKDEPGSSGADGPGERIRKKAGRKSPDVSNHLFADGKPVDRSLDLRKSVGGDAAEALAELSDYRPEVLPRALPRVRAGRKRGSPSVLVVGLGLACAGLIGFVVASRSGKAPDRPGTHPVPVAQETPPEPRSQPGLDPVAAGRPIAPSVSVTPEATPSIRPALATGPDAPPTDFRDDDRPTAAVSLLKDDTLDGWRTTAPVEVPNWIVQGGVLTYAAAGPSLMTTERFGDFELHLEFLLPPKCNSGVFLRGRYEVQLIDPSFVLPNGKRLAPDQNNGAIYGLIPPQRVVFSGVNRWNSLDVRLVGRTVSIRMNGIPVVDYKRADRVSQLALDDREGEPGPVVLQGHAVTGSKFRNITITPLPQGQGISPEAGGTLAASDKQDRNNPIGKWAELRPGTAAASRVRTFTEDGRLIFHLPAQTKSVEGTWRKEGERVYFSHPSTDKKEPPTVDKWFTIKKRDGNSMTILMMGQREYVWYRSS